MVKKNSTSKQVFFGGFLINEDCSPHRHIDHIGMHIDGMTKKYIDGLTYMIIGAAIEVHKEIGPGLLESIYERCLKHLLEQKGLNIRSQQRVPLHFQGLYLECDLRYDLLVEDLIIVEIKAVDGLLPIHEAQLLTYLRLMESPKGILINFNCMNIFNEGQKTLVTELYAQLPSG